MLDSLVFWLNLKKYHSTIKNNIMIKYISTTTLKAVLVILLLTFMMPTDVFAQRMRHNASRGGQSFSRPNTTHSMPNRSATQRRSINGGHNKSQNRSNSRPSNTNRDKSVTRPNNSNK